MNFGPSGKHITIEYCNSDYPSASFGDSPENLDEITEVQSVRYGVDHYIDTAREIDGPVVKLCTRAGRVAIALTREDFEIAGAELSVGIRDRSRDNFENEPDEVRTKINLVHAIATKSSETGAQ